MSATSWTEQQQRAIAAPGNLLVSAAAGSGKTAVLTERIARQVLSGGDITRMLVVTYTKGAAGEMKKRIAARLHELAAEHPEHAARLQQSALDSARANISTLHSFCAQVLRRHFQEAGLDPAFGIADEAQTELMKADALFELMEDRYSGGGEFAELAQLLGGDDRLCETILELYEFIYAQPDPLGWLDMAAERYNVSEAELAASPALSTLLACCKRQLSAKLEAYAALRADYREEFPGVAAVMDEDLLQLSAALRQPNTTAYAEALNVDFSRLSWPRGTEPAIKEPLSDARDAIKKLARAQYAALCRPLTEEIKLLSRLYPKMQLLTDVIRDLDRRYAIVKAEAGVIDYHDMEHLTLRLLRRPELSAEYRARFDYILVDEYQDANRVQEEIISAVKRPDNLFLVGDVKQSIYRFRMADPSLFTEKLDSYGGGAGMRVDLSQNFRSSECILEAANDVFSRIMSREVGEVDYDEAAALRPGNPDMQKGRVQLLLLPRGAAVETLSDAEAEALVAARRIREIMKNEQFEDPKTGRARPYRYGDFAVLHRSVKSVAQLWVQTLALEGVPAYAEITGGYFDAIEVRLFMDLLRVIDNRRQDIPLISVLRSVIGGFTTEELIELRKGRQGEDCLTSLLYLAGQDSAAGRKAAGLLASIERWRKLASLVSVEELIGRLMDETGYYEFVAALPGDGRRENLDALVERARAYEKQGVRGLHGFIYYMERVENTGKLGATAAAGADVVRVLSIHRSKGLEYPVVILSGLGKDFNTEDTRRDMLADRTLGLGLRCTVNGCKVGTLYRSAILASQKLAELSEEMRVLYVGMTRAQRQLIMLASVKDPDEALEKALTPPTPARTAEAGGPLALLLPAILDTAAGNALRAVRRLPPRPGSSNVEIAIASASRSAGARDEGEYRSFAAAAKLSEAAKLDWEYPHLADTQAPAKLSVSQLIGNYSNMKRQPSFIEAPASATDRGTAAHLVLQHIPLESYTEASAAAAIEQLQRQGLLTPEQALSASPKAVADFFASPLGVRLLASPRVERELEFSYRAPASRLLGLPSNEEVLLQGVIDCCFIEPEGWVIVDYKTDRFPAGGAQAAAQKHTAQLELYSEALCSLTGRPVYERYIHLLQTGDSVRV